MNKLFLSIFILSVLLFGALSLNAQMRYIPFEDQIADANIIVVATVTNAVQLADKEFFESGRATLKIDEILKTDDKNIKVGTEIVLAHPAPAPKDKIIMDYVGLVFKKDEQFIFVLKHSSTEGEYELAFGLYSRYSVDRLGEIKGKLAINLGPICYF